MHLHILIFALWLHTAFPAATAAPMLSDKNFLFSDLAPYFQRFRRRRIGSTGYWLRFEYDEEASGHQAIDPENFRTGVNDCLQEVEEAGSVKGLDSQIPVRGFRCGNDGWPGIQRGFSLDIEGPEEGVPGTVDGRYPDPEGVGPAPVVLSWQLMKGVISAIELEVVDQMRSHPVTDVFFRVYKPGITKWTTQHLGSKTVGEGELRGSNRR